MMYSSHHKTEEDDNDEQIYLEEQKQLVLKTITDYCLNQDVDEIEFEDIRILCARLREGDHLQCTILGGKTNFSYKVCFEGRDGILLPQPKNLLLCMPNWPLTTPYGIPTPTSSMIWVGLSTSTN